MKADTLQKRMDMFNELVASISDDSRREALQKMMEELGDRFFTAPASSRTSYHNCFVGGLVDHSLRVYTILKDMANKYGGLDDDSVKIVALFHDFGKIGSKIEDYYVPQTSKWHQEKLGEFYQYNTDIMYLKTSHRSLRLLGQYGVDLTDEEYQAILIHDGQYIDENKSYAHKECMLALLLHQADMLACKIEKDKVS